MSDQQAENAIRKAMNSLAAQNRPRNSATVPEAANECLLGDGASRDHSPERIQGAIGEMERRGELKASTDPWSDWSLTQP
jgi:pyridoxine 5'-phosphate synthase PdxJ